MAKHNHCDLVIFGSGSTAFAAALRAQELGKIPVMTEERTVGRICVNCGTEEVLGVSKAGHSAGQVIHEAAMAIRFRAKLHDFIDMLHVYPPMAEALKILAISRFKDPAKVSCCAE